jgi:hypothetical protein
MSALLRHTAARRLGGSMVQRAQAAFAEERRRLGPRLKHTDEVFNQNWQPCSQYFRLTHARTIKDLPSDSYFLLEAATCVELIRSIFS